MIHDVTSYRYSIEAGMSLVANYSDSDSEESDSEPVKSNAVDHISDEEDFHNPGHGAEDYFEEETEPDVFSIISQLPIAKVKAAEATFVDEAEVKYWIFDDCSKTFVV